MLFLTLFIKSVIIKIDYEVFYVPVTCSLCIFTKAHQTGAISMFIICCYLSLILNIRLIINGLFFCATRRLFPVTMRPVLVETLLNDADVDGKLRPFQLSIEEFNRICIAYQKICQQYPTLLKYDPHSKAGIDDEMMAKML